MFTDSKDSCEVMIHSKVECRDPPVCRPRRMLADDGQAF